METVTAQNVTAQWEAPEFDEIGCAPEVTMYVARMDD